MKQKFFFKQNIIFFFTTINFLFKWNRRLLLNSFLSLSHQQKMSKCFGQKANVNKMFWTKSKCLKQLLIDQRSELTLFHISFSGNIPRILEHRRTYVKNPGSEMFSKKNIGRVKWCWEKFYGAGSLFLGFIAFLFKRYFLIFPRGSSIFPIFPHCLHQCIRHHLNYLFPLLYLGVQSNSNVQ